MECFNNEIQHTSLVERVWSLRLQRYLAPCHIHEGTERSAGRLHTLDQIQHHYNYGCDHPTIYSSSICASRSQSASINMLCLSFPVLTIFEYIESNARTKSRTDMLTLCFNILYIPGPGHITWLSRSTSPIRSTSSSFGFGLFPIYHKASFSGGSLFLMQVKNTC